MSNCTYYHCGQPRACDHYGWCSGHRAGLATWICDHMKCPSSALERHSSHGAYGNPTSHSETRAQETIEPPIEQPIEPPQSVITEVDEQPIEQPIEQTTERVSVPKCAGTLPLLRVDSLPYYLDKIEEYNEPQELIEQLAKSQSEYNSKIELEMEEMRKKLAHYEEQKKIADEIHQLEEKVKSLQLAPEFLKETTGNPNASFMTLGRQPEKKVPPNLPKRTVSIPTTTPRPVVGNNNIGVQVGSKAPLKPQKK